MIIEVAKEMGKVGVIMTESTRGAYSLENASIVVFNGELGVTS